VGVPSQSRPRPRTQSLVSGPSARSAAGPMKGLGGPVSGAELCHPHRDKGLESEMAQVEVRKGHARSAPTATAHNDRWPTAMGPARLGPCDELRVLRPVCVERICGIQPTHSLMR